MLFRRLSIDAQDGLMQWAQDIHNDSLLFDDNASAPEFWSWIYFQLRESADDARWFPKGKWATIQRIEMELATEAKVFIEVQQSSGGKERG